MDLPAYFDRIGYSGPVSADRATLDAVMRAHVATIPFENLDVQLGRPMTIGVEAAFDKLVTGRRGGWCFEQNGLLGWALGEMGFDVTRIAAGVMRAAMGNVAIGNHLTLVVMLDGAPWLVDAGFGGSQAMPIPLAEGAHAHAPYALALSREADGYWRFTEWSEPDKPFSFDFRAEPADDALLAEKCAFLQSSPDSPFVPNLVVQRRAGERHRALRGRVLSERGADGETRRLIGSADELVATIDRDFGLDVPTAAEIWDRISARHDALFADDAAALTA